MSDGPIQPIQSVPTPGIKITLSGNGHLITSEGYTLYRFLPLYLQKNQPTLISQATLTWGDEWPEVIQPLIFHYVPLPAPSQAGPGIVASDLSSFEREDGKYGYRQVTYRGWWLYIFTEDRANEIKGAIPGIWDVVPGNVPVLNPDPDVGIPPVLAGGP